MAKTQGHGNPKWSREETILALELYHDLNGVIPSSEDSRVRALSSLLQDLPFHQGSLKNDSFRNPDGVAFKLQNIRSVATGKGLSNTSEMDQLIWTNLGDDKTKVKHLAKLVKKGIDLPGPINLIKIKPLKHTRIIDIVQEAGIDVSDWSNFKGGVNKASTNPKYCFEWGFIETGRVALLNLWYTAMKETNGVIYQDLNLRKDSEGYKKDKRGRWRSRALSLDKVIQQAWLNNLPILVNICDENIVKDKPKSRVARADRRMLDKELWKIVRYDEKTGDCRVERGEARSKYVDQHSESLDKDISPNRREVIGKVFDRDPIVRQAVLERAKGHCEYCSKEGFRKSGGKIYLETHHIIHLSKYGPDKIDNVIALCPNDHKEVHHGERAEKMTNEMIEIVRRIQSQNKKSQAMNNQG